MLLIISSVFIHNTFNHHGSVGGHSHPHNSALTDMNLLNQAIAEVTGHDELFKTRFPAPGYPQLPDRQLHHLGLVTVVHSHHSFFPVRKSAVAQKLVIICQEL